MGDENTGVIECLGLKSCLFSFVICHLGPATSHLLSLGFLFCKSGISTPFLDGRINEAKMLSRASAPSNSFQDSIIFLAADTASTN